MVQSNLVHVGPDLLLVRSQFVITKPTSLAACQPCNLCQMLGMKVVTHLLSVICVTETAVIGGSLGLQPE